MKSPTRTLTLVAMLMAGEVMPLAGWTQVLTTGGTAGSSINDGANIGAGNHTGASINPDNPEADQIRAKLGVQGQATAKQNTLDQLNSPAATDNPAITPAMTGPDNKRPSSVHGNTAAAQVKGAAKVADILPRGVASYTYYPQAQVYYSSGTKTYYYSQKGRWYSSASLPPGVSLGSSHTVKLTGNATIP